MSRQKIIVQDRVGHHYRLQLRHSPPLSVTAKAKRFSDESSARQFVSKLRVSDERWPQILRQANGASANRQLTAPEYHRAIAGLMASGAIKVYKLDHLNGAGRQAVYPAITTQQSEQYRFMPVSAVLAGEVRETQNFQQGAQQAHDFIEQLGLSDGQLKNVLDSLGLPASAGSAALAQAIMEGKVVVARAPVPQVKTDGADSESATDTAPGEVPAKSATLGPHEAGGAAAAAASVDVAEKEDAPPCSLEGAVVQCSHGRSVQITKETRDTPSLSVISTETKDEGLELISVEIQASELCSSHKNSAFKLSKEHALISTTATKAEFKVSCDKLNRSNVFRRLWLPSVKPKVYSIAIKETCEAPEIETKKVEVLVYPDMKWHWSTSINLGKLDFVPGKAEVKYSDPKIDGNVDFTYDGKKHDAKEKYKKYITEPLDGFKKICDAVAAVLKVINDPKAALMRIASQTDKKKPADGKDNKDGNETRLAIQWPKLSIDYDSALVENGSSTYVDHDYSIKLVATPLLDIDIQVDVLESMIALATSPSKELIQYAKKRIEEDFEEGQQVGVRGELDIIFTVKATMDIKSSEIKGLHNVSEHDVTVAPVKGDIQIPAHLKGAVKAEGKWFIISFAVNYKMEGKTEWAGEYEFGHDDIGIYFSNTVEFKGIDVTLTKYEEVKVEVESKKQVDDDYDVAGVEYKDDLNSGSLKMEDGKVEGEVTLKAKEEQRWSWMKPEKDPETSDGKSTEKKPPIKHYFVKH